MPYNFISKVLAPKHSIHQQLQIVPGGRVAVEVDAGGFLEHPLASQQPRRHVGQVGRQAAAAGDVPPGRKFQQPAQLLVEGRIPRGDVFEGLVLGR